METVANDKDWDQRILVEQIKVLYRSFWPVCIASLLAGSSLVYGLWDVTSHTLLVGWLGILMVTYALRGVLYYLYRDFSTAENAVRFGLYFVIGSATAGSVYGFGSILILPAEQLNYQLLVLVILVGLGSGSVSSLTSYKPAFFAYFPISLIPIGTYFVLQDDSIHQALGFMTLAFVVGISYFGINFNRSFKESLNLRFENIDLVEQLREQKNEADNANMAKSKFLAAASHDLRQPLHALTLFTSVLDESIQYPKVRRVVDQIKASVDALQNLFNTLLDISLLDAGVLQVEKSRFYLASLFKTLENDFDSQADDKDLLINWPTSSYAVHTDPTLFEQILRNYLSNAIRYTEKGEISITCETSEQGITIHIIDTGLGIPDNELQSIFGEFNQLSNPERDRSKGLGLGLAIVQRTANLLGHKIEVKSQLGKGSIFSITVDQAQLVEPTASPGASESGLEAEIRLKSDSSPLIIVIDDEKSVREGMQSLLEIWECEVITASDKAEAMALLSQIQRAPDGIIADYRLRENKTGVDAIRAIHAEYHEDIPALIVTGDIAVERLREVSSSGFQMLHKPVAPIKLRTFLRNIERRNQTEAEAISC